MATTHTVPNNITVHAVEMPVTHRIVHCAVVCRDGVALAYFPTEWIDRTPVPGNHCIVSMSDAMKLARWH